MNKTLLIAVKAVIIVALFALFASNTFSAEVNTSYTEVSKNELKQRIENLQSEVDLRYTTEIHGIINTYIKKYRRGSERLLGLSEQFFPLYEAAFAKTGIPEELKFLSVIESGLKPTAISSSGAAGLWQFMKATGRLYDLRINDVVDERRDPIKSTQAASEYLKDLYSQFGDWTLALAAYNCGPGNVRKSLRGSQERDFWSMKNRGYLPKETRRYIPKYVAMSYLMNYSHIHELYPEYNTINTLATVRIYDYTTFKELSRITGIDRDEIAKLNPSFLRNYIPRSTQGYYLTLPQEDLYHYLSQVGGFENLVDLGYDSSTLKGRYMLYGAMKKKFSELSQLENREGVFQIYSNLSNPLNAPRKLAFNMMPKEALSSRRKLRTYQLKPQESLMDVAQAQNIKLSTLLKINEIDVDLPLQQGATIKLE